MSEIIELTTTVETHEQALGLARLLIDSRLAACVQINGPIQSVYRWQGEICEASEYRCTAKSLRGLTSRLMEVIMREHPYETPELLVVDVADCGPAYAQWLRSQVDAGT